MRSRRSFPSSFTEKRCTILHQGGTAGVSARNMPTAAAMRCSIAMEGWVSPRLPRSTAVTGWVMRASRWRPTGPGSRPPWTCRGSFPPARSTVIGSIAWTAHPAADLEVDGVDALVTDLPEVGIMVQHADCQAVLLFDPLRRVIGAVHSGWRGSVQNILGKTVGLIVSRYHSRAEDLLAVISPSLGPCCSEFVNHRHELPPHFQRYRAGENHFDFWRISQEQLIAAGLRPASISVAGVCTSCSRDYFSYRRACREGDGVTGRNCSVVVLGKGE